jgi:hypothetical protein
VDDLRPQGMKRWRVLHPHVHDGVPLRAAARETHRHLTRATER